MHKNSVGRSSVCLFHHDGLVWLLAAGWVECKNVLASPNPDMLCRLCGGGGIVVFIGI